MFEGTVLLVLFLVLAAASVVYFLPTILAIRRKRRDIAAIVILNIFTGWSLIGWGICLARVFEPDGGRR